MSAGPATNGQRAAFALQAVTVYARSSPFEGLGEHSFFFDFERDVPPGADQDRLAALLCGLMHYAERRGLSVPDAVAAAQEEYGRQRTTFLPGHAVQRNPRGTAQAPAGAPLIGEVIAARPGRPARYHVDFLTTREWVRQPLLAPAPPFPAITTSYGTFSSAFVAAHCLRQVVSRIEASSFGGRPQDSGHTRDLNTILAAMSSWSGLPRDTLLSSFSQLLTERDGHLIAGDTISHPVRLAAISMPTAPTTAPGEQQHAAPAAPSLPAPSPRPRPGTR